jgi:hypothetical protein
LIYFAVVCNLTTLVSSFVRMLPTCDFPRLALLAL